MSDQFPYRPYPRVAFSFPAEPDSIREVRHLIVNEAHALPFSQDELDDIALAISEVFTNLVQYAAGHHIRGVCEIRPEELEVRFEVDASVADYLEKRQLPTGLTHRGRGIPLLHMLLPTVEVRGSGNGKAELRLVKPVEKREDSDETHSGS